MTRIGAIAAVAIALLAAGVPTAGASTSAATVDRLERFWDTAYAPQARAAHGEIPTALLAKAAADECYGGVGASFVAKGTGACEPGRAPKVNQAYVWGLAKSGDDLWFGTAPNVQCLVLSSYLGMTAAQENDSWSCEFGQSGFRQTMPQLPAALGDWRPSQLYRYHVADGTLQDVGVELAGVHAARLRATLGIRSAGGLGRLVLFAGPSMSLGGGLNVFAFDGVTGNFVSSTTLPAYDNIRRWIVAGGDLYTAVGKTGGGGALLKWNGDPGDLGTAAAPNPALFDLVEVGTLPAEGADLAEHQGRIFVTTWPETIGGKPVYAGLYMSRPLGTSGLGASSESLQEVWKATDYEPDAVTAATYGGGALASHDGKLVWGTMHVPFTATLAHVRAYASILGGQPGTKDALAAVAGTWRAVAIFSGQDLGTPQQRVRVLYGNTVLPAYVPGKGWTLQPNKAHQVPKFGTAGFGDPFNNYTWVMGETKRGLYIGTMDWSYLFAKALPLVVEQISGKTVPADALDMPAGTFGADLVRFGSLAKPAATLSRSGAGNPTNYGIRTMVSEPERLYLGTANPMNLMTDPSAGIGVGGWELRRLGPEAEIPTPGQPVVPVPTPVPATTTGPVTGQSQSSGTCQPRRKFTMHLGFRLQAASRTGMRNVRRTKATVDGKAVTPFRSPNGIDVPVDLRGTSKKRITVRVELLLRKPVRVMHRDGARTTKRIVREYRFIVCA